ncbi:ABC transporter substrate-binding protein [Salinactinospora qingdaonensis]|uniref:ABC transporter substrate-binding protein n=1 Tax=Salinactinospora qingdaonensis TaxID=702744 RepID=A0ABP7FML9_9ACTN
MPRNKALSLTAVAAAMALGLTACGGGGTESSGEGESSGSEAEPLQLGYVFPETGDLSFLGPPQIEAAGMAMQEINDAGGVLDQELPEILSGDEANDAAQANEAASRLLDQDVDAIMGAAASGMTMAIIDKVTGAEVVQCSGSNTAPPLSDYDDGGYYFRTAPSDALQGPILADTILGDGHQSVAITYRADDYGEGLANSAADALEQAGAQVTLQEGYDPKASNFDSVVNAIANSDAEAVLMVSFEEGVQIIQGLLEAGIAADQMYSADGLNDETLAEKVDEANPSAISGFKGTAPNVDNAEFTERLQEFAPDLEVFQFGPQVYDCVMLTALAAEQAGSTDPAEFADDMVSVSKEGEQCSGFAECRDLIAEGTDIDYEGASGSIDFDDNGDVTSTSIMVYGFNSDGEHEALDYVDTGTE